MVMVLLMLTARVTAEPKLQLSLPGAGNGDVEAAVVPATEVATVSDGGAAEPMEVVELEVVVEAVWEEAILIEH